MLKKIVLWLRALHVLLKIYERKLICVLMFAVVLRMLLNGVIGQMNHPIFEVFGCEVFGGGANVPFFIPKAAEVSIDCGY